MVPLKIGFFASRVFRGAPEIHDSAQNQLFTTLSLIEMLIKNLPAATWLD